MPNTASPLRRILGRWYSTILARLMRPSFAHDPVSFDIWERRGLHLTPAHFYSPIPDTRELRERLRPTLRVGGIDLRTDAQLALLARIGRESAPTLGGLPKTGSPEHGFFLENDAFTGIDPLLYVGVLEAYRPRRVVEVGSGFSTMLAAQVLASRRDASLQSIDPWPRPFIEQGVPGVDLVKHRVEELPLDHFTTLEAGDVLFIDSSHVVRAGSDVNYLFLEVLPYLAEGVLVHVHDIFLPDEYPRAWLVEQKRFWSEQYLLAAFLCHNSRAEVLLAAHFLGTRHRPAVVKALPWATRFDGGSFWIRMLGS